MTGAGRILLGEWDEVLPCRVERSVIHFSLNP